MIYLCKKTMMISVITGDIVKSSSIRDENRAALLALLKKTFGEINNTVLSASPANFEIFRGDSFQVVISQPELALITAVLIRAGLRGVMPESPPEGTRPGRTWDARLSIGIGEIFFDAGTAVESDGPAFRFSGTLLDEMKKTGSRLGIRTPWDDVNGELRVSCSFADQIISHWSAYQAQAVYHQLSENLTQQKLAERLGISQPGVSNRLITGNLPNINLMLERYHKLITSRHELPAS